MVTSGTRTVVAGVLLMALAWPLPAGASSQSQQLYAKALIPFHAQRWEEAYLLLDEATKADPRDALATYYRGLCGARLGFTSEAIHDIEKALELRQDLPSAPLDLGILFFETEQYDRAEQWLRRAHEHPPSRFSAALFLGVSRFRQGDDPGARKHLADAAKDPNLRPAAQYYDALTLLRQGHENDARALLAKVQAARPESEAAAAAQAYRAAPRRTRRGARPEPKREAPWYVYADVGFAYDANVVLDPDDGGSGRGSDESDGRTVFGLGGRYRLRDSDRVRATLSYDFHQSVHFDLDEFDLQGHRVRLDLATPPGGLFQFGVSGLYDFYALDYKSYYQQGQGTPWVTVFTGRVAATQLYYTLRSRDFFRSPFDPWRDAVNNAVGLRQYLLLGAVDRFLSMGYQWHDNDPLSRCGADFAYSGNQFDVDINFALRDWATGIAGYLLRLEDYEHPNSRSSFDFRRRDKVHELGLRLERAFTNRLSANVAYFGLFNDSNLSQFEYDRHIVSTEIRWSF